MTGSVFTPVTIVSLGTTAIFAVIAYMLAVLLGKKNTSTDKWVLCWLIYDALIHFILEGSFIYFSLTGTVNESKHWMSALWKEYAIADKRWGVSDPTIVSLELLTVFLCGPLCVILVHAVVNNLHYRHWLQIVLCVCELYGGWMTFVPDILLGSPNLVTNHWLYMWVYLVFFNGIWVIIPVLLLYQSYEAMKYAFLIVNPIPNATTQRRAKTSKKSSKKYFLNAKDR